MRDQLLEDHGMWFGSRPTKSQRGYLAGIPKSQLRVDIADAITGRYSGGPDCVSLESNMTLTPQDIARLENSKASEVDDIYQSILDQNDQMDYLGYDDL